MGDLANTKNSYILYINTFRIYYPFQPYILNHKHIHTSIHSHIYIFKPYSHHIHLYIYTSIHLYTYTSIHLYIYISIHLYIYTSIHLYTYTYTQCSDINLLSVCTKSTSKRMNQLDPIFLWQLT